MRLTGSLSVTIFAGAMPPTPIVAAAKAGAEIKVYIAGQLAFCGTVDKREGQRYQEGQGRHRQTNQREGKGAAARRMQRQHRPERIHHQAVGARQDQAADRQLTSASDHQHDAADHQRGGRETGRAVEDQVEWKGETIKLDKVRFRDGARVVDELHRVATGELLLHVRDAATASCGSLTASVGRRWRRCTDPRPEHPDVFGRAVRGQGQVEVKVKGQRSEKNNARRGSAGEDPQEDQGQLGQGLRPAHRAALRRRRPTRRWSAARGSK